MELRVKSKFWIVDAQGQPVFGGGRMKILEKIDELGSIRAAATDLKMSYRAVWGKIKVMEERLGMTLVETAPGGGPSRGAKLTPQAYKFLEMFYRFQDMSTKRAVDAFEEVFSETD